MQVILDIPEPLYRALDSLAHAEHRSVQELFVAHAADICGKPRPAPLKHQRVQLPLIPAGEPGTIDLTKNLNDAFFADFESA